jgi:single-strand DNA-binding protein
LNIEGKIQTRSWEKDGIKRYTTEIYADTIQLLGKRPENADAPVAAAAAPVADLVEAPPPAEDDLPF